jgi:sulfur-carrier protein
VEHHTVQVRIPGALLARTGHRGAVDASGQTVREIISSLDQAYPGLRFNICHETGELRPFVNIFLGNEDVRYMQGLDTPVTPGATIHIFHSVAGG